MKVGEDILNQCTKCGDVKHVVVALVDGNVAKVECKECGSQHRYRARTGKTAAAPAKKKKATKARTVKKAAPPGPSVEPDMSRPIRPYRTTDTYAVGDRIAHDSFGTGVVEQVMPKKVHAFFEDGPRTLLHARGA